MKLGIAFLVIGILLLILAIPYSILGIIFGITQLEEGNISVEISAYYRIIYIVLAFVFLTLVLGALLFHLFRVGTNLGTQLGTRVAAARMLRWMSVALSLFALSMVIMQVDIMGGSILYLTLGVVCLSIASLL